MNLSINMLLSPPHHMMITHHITCTHIYTPSYTMSNGVAPSHLLVYSLSDSTEWGYSIIISSTKMRIAHVQPLEKN